MWHGGHICSVDLRQRIAMKPLSSLIERRISLVCLLPMKQVLRARWTQIFKISHIIGSNLVDAQTNRSWQIFKHLSNKTNELMKKGVKSTGPYFDRIITNLSYQWLGQQESILPYLIWIWTLKRAMGYYSRSWRSPWLGWSNQTYLFIIYSIECNLRLNTAMIEEGKLVDATGNPYRLILIHSIRKLFHCIQVV